MKRTKFVKMDDMDLVTDRFDLNTAQAGGAGETVVDGVGAGETQQPHPTRVWDFNDEKGAWGKIKRVGMWLFL